MNNQSNNFETWQHLFPAHDESPMILFGLLRVEHAFINEHHFDPHVKMTLDDATGRIVAECRLWFAQCQKEENYLQQELLGRLEKAFWQLAHLQCVEAEQAP